MCWIAFAKGKELHRVLGRQRERWLDWVWIATESALGYKACLWDKDEKWKYVWLDERFKWYVDYIKWIVAQDWLEEQFCLFHHRKWSVWSTSIANTHPFSSKKFCIMQNWTERLLRTWWDVEWIDSDKTDTYCLLQFLTAKAKNLHEVIDLLDWLLDLKISLGVLLIIDIKTRHILFYSDWTRESYISFWTKKETIDMIESWHGNDRKIAHVNTWYMIFTYQGNILDRDIKNPNEEIKPKVSWRSYTDDDWVTRYPPSYTVEETKSHSSFYDTKWKRTNYNSNYKTRWQEEVENFIGLITKSINKWDVRVWDIENIPVLMKWCYFHNNKALKKFRKTYEQALKRAAKYDQQIKYNEHQKLEAEKVFETWVVIFSRLLNKNKEDRENNKTTTESDNQFSHFEVDIIIHSCLKKFDSSVFSKQSKEDTDLHEEYEKYNNINPDTPPEDKQTTIFLPPQKSELDKEIADRLELHEDFLSSLTMPDDIATPEQITFGASYPTKIKNINIVWDFCTLTRFNWTVIENRIQKLLINKENNWFSVLDPFNFNKCLSIKFDWDNALPVLCEQSIS